MRHVFKALKEGWDKEYEGVWFDANMYSVEEARNQFVEKEKDVLKNNHWCKGKYFEYDGQTYHNYQYLGTYEDDKMPKNDTEYLDSLIEQCRNKKEAK